MIEILINSESHRFDTQITIENILKNLKIKIEGTAVAVNNKVVPRSMHPEFNLFDGDRLEIIRAAGGG